jgi:hypothetical protein
MPRQQLSTTPVAMPGNSGEGDADSGGKANTIPGRRRTVVGAWRRRHFVAQEVFGFVKENLLGASRRKTAVSGETGTGEKGSPCPGSDHCGPERGKRSNQYVLTPCELGGVTKIVRCHGCRCISTKPTRADCWDC